MITFLLWLCFLDISSGDASINNDRPFISNQTTPQTAESPKPLSVLILTSIYPAHFFPLLALGEELVNRGHNVTMLGPTMEGYESLPVAAQDKGIRFLSSGFEPRDVYDTARNAGKHDGKSNIMRFFYNLTRQLYDEDTHMHKMVKILKKKANDRFDYVVCDYVVINVLFYIISAWNTDRVMLSFTPVPMHPLNLNPWSVPSFFSPFTDNMSFTDRLLSTVLYGPIEWITLNFVVYHFSANLNDEMKSSSPFDFYMGVKYPIIYNTLVGIDWVRATLPLQHYVGPMLSSSQLPLDDSLSKWLEDKPANSVIYVSMGTSGDITPEIASAVLSVSNDHYIVWSSRNDLTQYSVNKEKVYLASWVSQLALLEHPSISCSIMQCGLNSVQESLYNGVPVVCIPLAFDQFDVSIKMVSHSLGSRLLPDEISEKTLIKALEEVNGEKIRNKVKKMQKIMKANGGRKKAADLVELYADVGHDHGIPSYAKYNWYWYEFYNIDVYIVVVMVSVVGMWLMRKICSYVCCKKNRQKTKND